MNIVVIANPSSGTGQTGNYVREFSRVLIMRGHRVETLLTTGRGKAAAMAGQLAGGVDRLVIAGGDGTVNEVLNGLGDPSRVPILHLATGTANMLARDLRLPRKPAALAEILEYGAIRPVDMGCIGDKRFLLLASVGFDATVAQEVQRTRGATLGYQGYAVPMLRGLARWCPTDLVIQVDGGEKLVGANVMVLKVKHYGGFLTFSSRAELDSGHFEVFVFRDGTVRALLKYGLAAFLGKVSSLSDVKRVEGTSITIESCRPAAVEVDGDYFGTTPINVELTPCLVPMVVPRN